MQAVQEVPRGDDGSNADADGDGNDVEEEEEEENKNEEEDPTENVGDVSIDQIGNMVKQLINAKRRHIKKEIGAEVLASVLEESDTKLDEDLTMTGLTREFFNGFQSLGTELSASKGDDDEKGEKYYQPTFPKNRRFGIFIDRRKDETSDDKNDEMILFEV